MTPVELSRTVLCAVRRAVDAGELSVPVPERAVVVPPGPGGRGDYATNVALQLARPAGQPAQRVAEVLRGQLLGLDGIDDAFVTGPGFLNISLGGADAGAGFERLVADILRTGTRYGYGDSAAGQVVRLRCAAEPRALVVGDALARLLRSQGASVRGISVDRPLPPRWEAVLGCRTDGDACRADGDTITAGAVSAAGTSPGKAPLDLHIRPLPVPPADTGRLLSLGRDAGRWALLYPAGRDRVRLGAEHLAQRESNPLFRVRYAHARTRALRRNAADLGFTPRPGQPGRAGTDAVRPLLTALADHPRILARAAADRAPDRLARHLLTVADHLLPLLPGVLPAGEEKPSAAHRARLALAEAAGTVLAGGLTLLGIDAPDHL
ncbi:ArgS-related anticodon-binding protein NrtL [Streptomyces sp. NPDC047017]|uniref:ArgS-related anticodon-binding protein NrtL n=1 Tax=Streptomyces sp. NPDC047017 TaxID=3155024 RepID=UPI0034020DFB